MVSSNGGKLNRRCHMIRLITKDGTIYQAGQKVKVPKEITERLLESLERESGDK